MQPGLKIVLIAVLLLIVIAVFVSPAVDLEPTALRAVMQAVILFASIAVVRTFACCIFKSSHPLDRWLFRYQERSPKQSQSLLDLYGARLC